MLQPLHLVTIPHQAPPTPSYSKTERGMSLLTLALLPPVSPCLPHNSCSPYPPFTHKTTHTGSWCRSCSAIPQAHTHKSAYTSHCITDTPYSSALTVRWPLPCTPTPPLRLYTPQPPHKLTRIRVGTGPSLYYPPFSEMKTLWTHALHLEHIP